MMTLYTFIDVAPDPVRGPVGIGIAAVVILFIIGSVFLLSAGLLLFLWLRKRRMRHAEMIRPAGSTINDSRTPTA
ncbi:MAG TPA: hypothetical protein VHP99_13275 [Pyrinomonadaceae bacterium]|nr:hypothetical protein [Pyrinomonadaceae bacterium]